MTNTEAFYRVENSAIIAGPMPRPGFIGKKSNPAKYKFYPLWTDTPDRPGPDYVAKPGDPKVDETNQRVVITYTWDKLPPEPTLAESDVGSILMSILATPPGPLWRLADGSDCTGTAYATVTGDSTLPDLRGAYLRMAGRNASNSAWDGGALGNWQEDRTARPDTAFTTNNAGAHTHSLGWYDQEAAGIVQQYGAWNAANPSPQVRHMNKIEDPSDGSNPAERTSNEREMAVSTDGQHVHAINGGGDAETRPKTYCVNYFIKVN